MDSQSRQGLNLLSSANTFHVLVTPRRNLKMTSMTRTCVTMTVVIILLAMAVSSAAQLTVDLTRGTSSPLPEGITWYLPLSKHLANLTCNHKGVLKLTFAPLMRVRAQINMTFEKSVGFTFDLGDSSKRNDGYGGDDRTRKYIKNNAEVHSFNNGLFFYQRDAGVKAGSTALLHSEPSFVGVNPYTTLTLDVKDEWLRANNGIGLVQVQSHNLFQLRGQYNPRGWDYDLYLGLNRVVNNRFRDGVGLCSVSIQFFAS